MDADLRQQEHLCSPQYLILEAAKNPENPGQLARDLLC
jgi:hypothetical protein